MRFVGRIPAAAREEGRMWHCGPRREALGARRRPRGGPGSLPGQVATCRPVGAAGCPSEQTHGRPASTTRSPETPGTPSPTARTLTTAFPHSQSPSDSLCDPPPPLPRPRQAWKRRSVQGPRPQQGSGSGTGSHCQRPRPWQSPEGFLQEKAGTVQGGESPPGGAGCLGPALAGAPGRPHTHASAEGKLEAETTTWPAQLWLRAPGRGRAPGAAGGGLTATRTTDGACPGAPQSPSLPGCAPRAGRDGSLPPPGALVGAAGR